MPGQPLVSIIIPTYNRAHLIGETLDSVLTQTYQNWECIVVDDGSTDRTEKLLHSYISKDSRFQYHKRPNDRLKGGNAARNYGFEMSEGEFIQWFDDDDIMLPEFLKLKLSAFKEGIDLVICSGFKVDRALNIQVSLNFDDTLSLYKGFVLWRHQLTTNCILFKRQFLANQTLFNPQILRGQESEFFSRLFFELPKTKYSILSKELFLYRQHESTKSAANKVYKPAFKTSEIFVATENLKRGLMLKDPELIQYFYRLLIHFLFRVLEHQDILNAKNVLNSLTKIIKPLNWWLSLQLQIMGSVLQLQKRGYYKIEMYFKNYRI